ncbi:MAG TPA: DUF5996 family protein [Rhizomicrobium sp.]|jgi:hypothetical protein|nr:DUF5996 family protein [Rhizomicrobium sp.]
MPAIWPELEYREWRETALTLQLWLQVAGKVRLALTPWLNHSWQVPYYVTARGLTTSPIPHDGHIFDLEFDFLSHRVVGRGSSGAVSEFPLEAMSVADFYQKIVALLAALEVRARITPLPSEVIDPIPFEQDHARRPYDSASVQRFWRILVTADHLFKLFRTGFLGKASPVHVFWGGFDLAVTRFSGRRAPLHPGGIPGLSDRVTREAYSHEVSSAGFWAGNGAYPHAAFYSYAYPEPKNFRDAVMPPGVTYEAQLGEFILPYDIVRKSPAGEKLVMDFLQASYAAAADLGKWDRAALDCATGRPGKPRLVE